ncbi:MAG: TerC/Alx family metal homeostasis membrane protein [Candidatus Lightella neohaematopini]|nr:TerC/Alx family metal homeostasis membrane protein [Candidatus Lightella neohaematopini]
MCKTCLILNNKNQKNSLSKLLFWLLFWIASALLFNIILWIYFFYTHGLIIANKKAIMFLVSYLLEKLLSIDNLFFWFTIFKNFNIPNFLQRYLLSVGAFSAVLIRVLIIIVNQWIVNYYQFILYLFGLLILFTGIKMLVPKNNQTITNYNIMNWLYKNLRITNKLYGKKFFIKKQGIIFATPLLIVFLTIEISDIIFTCDSIPVIFSITNDLLIILTSNIFAMLGMRNTYFFLEYISKYFLYINYGLSMTLIFIGIKILLMKYIYMSALFSLMTILFILIISIIISIIINKI